MCLPRVTRFTQLHDDLSFKSTAFGAVPVYVYVFAPVLTIVTSVETCIYIVYNIVRVHVYTL